jgi:hypothetical protein
MLVAALLNKDYNKRPNIFEVAQIPCIKKAIIKFVNENNLRDDVMALFDMDSGERERGQAPAQDLST